MKKLSLNIVKGGSAVISIDKRLGSFFCQKINTVSLDFFLKFHIFQKIKSQTHDPCALICISQVGKGVSSASLKEATIISLKDVFSNQKAIPDVNGVQAPQKILASATPSGIPHTLGRGYKGG